MYNFTERLLKDSSRTSTAIQASFSVIIAESLHWSNITQPKLTLMDQQGLLKESIYPVVVFA